MRPTSSAFADDGVIPRRFTCDGEDVSAPLAWSDVPPGVPALRCSAMIQKRGLARGVIGRSTTFPPTAPSLPRRRPPDFELSINDFRRPAKADLARRRATDRHYHFRLALSVFARVTRPTCKDAEREARKHVLSEAAGAVVLTSATGLRTVLVPLDRVQQICDAGSGLGIVRLRDDSRASRAGADIFLIELVEVDLLVAFDGRALVRHARTHFILDSHGETPSVASVDGRNLQGRDGPRQAITRPLRRREWSAAGP